MDKLYLDILRVGRSMGKLSYEELHDFLISKGYDWDEISNPTRKWFDENFESIDSKIFVLKSEVLRWILDYESNRIRNFAIFIFAILFSIVCYQTLKKPQVIPRNQINGFKN